ncbi:transcriptional regulator [Parabacteroides acidifaciens]|uniref:Transcriptional regulator n=2 Tax=Parabacteroides TaxID=375288 RepID=A0A3D8HGW0_9BACT|nr:DUF6377 domain-containing protein [Parabacteroides acidifaciens]MBC8601153.1 transcriptional regulator [Parabacteroides acidifaciens]RDU50215.1 transcriptional regulator [Parabacteroides acidifaciens]
MRERWRIILFLLFTANIAFADNNLDSILIRLDQTILRHEIYKNAREARIRVLKEKAVNAEPVSLAAYQLNDSIFREYKSYMCDSAVHYLNKNVEIARKLHDREREYKSIFLLSSLLATAGMYQEAVDMLGDIRREQLPSSLIQDYYVCKEHVYREISGNSREPKSKRRYGDLSLAYRDSLLRILPEGVDKRIELQELVLRADGRMEDACRINDARLARVPFGSPEYALTSYQRAMIYRQEGNREKEKLYLALSSLSDVQSAITDHASLWMLADLLLKDGDIERAYHYIRFSWDETNRFRARSRSWQSADILSLIDKNYQATIEKKNRMLVTYLALISLLTLLLISAVIYIYRQMKRLAEARNHLQETNGQLKVLNGELHQMNARLQSANRQLSESNQIKEEYIGRFIKLCSTYIDKLDGYRRMVNKKVCAGQIEELAKITRSSNALNAELDELYKNFDTAFLHLFPNFVAQFNALLQEDEQIVLKRDELLNTELRIFALIRLGINDSSQIAEFLRYSVNTIYNYRAKVKNKACVSRDDFENLVREIH